MGFHFRCNILNSTAWPSTGHPSSMTSSAIGRPTRTAPTLISCVRVFAETPLLVGGYPLAPDYGVTSENRQSVFHFDVQGSVAKSTHSGLPWLRYFRQYLGDRFIFGRLMVGVCPPDPSVNAGASPSFSTNT